MSARIAAVGAGRMGRGMAIAFAYAGHDVLLIDAKKRATEDYDRLAQEARDELLRSFTMLGQFNMLEPDDIPGMMDRITLLPRDQASQLSSADVIFEGVPETLPAKEEAFALISNLARENAIIASTTSTILSTQLQGFVKRPERFLNAHWLNPAFLVPLVELSPGDQTDPDTTQTLKTLLEKIGKVPVICTASPGYIVPRIQVLAMNEAARLVEDGVASAEDIDKATKYGFGFRFAILGLLEFIDWGGGDILFHASNYMSQATGESRFNAPDIIQHNMSHNRNGLKDGKGFLDYDGLDIPAYQMDRFAAFVAMLRHMDKLPPKA